MKLFNNHSGLRGLPCFAEGILVWYGMVEVCEGAPVAVSGWVWYGMVESSPFSGLKFCPTLN